MSSDGKDTDVLAAENAELKLRIETLLQTVRTQSLFMDISTVLSSALDLPALVGSLLDKLMSRSSLKGAAFFVIKDETAPVLYDIRGIASTGQSIQALQQMAQAALKSGSMVLHSDAAITESIVLTQEGAKAPQFAAAFPCRFKKQVNCVLCASNDAAPDLNVLSSLGTLAPTIGLTVDNILSYDRLVSTTELLKKEKNRLNTVLVNMSNGLLALDTDGILELVNPALEQMLGFDVSDYLGSHFLSIPFPSELSELVGRTVELKSQSVLHETFRHNEQVLRAVSTEISAAEGVSTGSVTVLRDITDEWEVDRMKTEFISTVSHELRTPLTSVLGFSKMIQKSFLKDLSPFIDEADAPPEIRKKADRSRKRVLQNLDIIVSEGERLTELINNVLDIAKMEAGKIDWNDQPMDMAEVIERAGAATSALFESKGLQFIKNIAEDLPVTSADRDRFIQVVINLISNAVKFTTEGAVTVSAIRDDNKIKVSVTDTGEGIAEEDLSKVFEKFKQVGDTLSNRPKGTGLGLPICKQIVEHYGGVLWVESRPGEGSTFSFTLPAAKTALYDIDRLLRSIASSDELMQELSESSVVRKILVADDDPAIRELLNQALTGRGYLVTEAEDGMKAVERARAELPDLIVLDVMMPNLNGFDAASVLKNTPETAHIPILILSVIDDRERGRMIGVDRYLTKPVSMPVLFEEIEGVFTRTGGRKIVLLIEEHLDEVAELVEALKRSGYTVLRACDCTEAARLGAEARPDMVFMDSRLTAKVEAVESLKKEEGLRESAFFVLGMGK